MPLEYPVPPLTGFDIRPTAVDVNPVTLATEARLYEGVGVFAATLSKVILPTLKVVDVAETLNSPAVKLGSPST